MEEYSIALKTYIIQDPKIGHTDSKNAEHVNNINCLWKTEQNFFMRLCILVHIPVTVESPGLVQCQENSKYSRNINWINC